MKSLEFVDCDIIQDLLPSYIDKISSISTNQLVEMHLQKCKDCNIALKSMNKNIEIENIDGQREQIDYLKTYRKKKIETIYIAIMSTIGALIAIFLILYHMEFFINTNEITFGYSQKNIDSGKDELIFWLSSQKYDLKLSKYEVVNETGKKSIHIKTVGKYPFSDTIATAYCSVKIDENIEKIYIEDKKGNLKEIWDKEKDETYNWKYLYNIN